MRLNPDWNGNPALLSDTERTLLATPDKQLSKDGRLLKRHMHDKIWDYKNPKPAKPLSDADRQKADKRKAARLEARMEKAIGLQIKAEADKRTDNEPPYNPARAAEELKQQKKDDRTFSRGAPKQLSDRELMLAHGWGYRTFVEKMKREPKV